MITTRGGVFLCQRFDELADGTGIGKCTIITIENEAGANPSVGTVKRLLKYFEITFEELYPAENEG